MSLTWPSAARTLSLTLGAVALLAGCGGSSTGARATPTPVLSAAPKPSNNPLVAESTQECSRRSTEKLPGAGLVQIAPGHHIAAGEVSGGFEVAGVVVRGNSTFAFRCRAVATGSGVSVQSFVFVPGTEIPGVVSSSTNPDPGGSPSSAAY